MSEPTDIFGDFQDYNTAAALYQEGEEEETIVPEIEFENDYYLHTTVDSSELLAFSNQSQIIIDNDNNVYTFSQPSNSYQSDVYIPKDYTSLISPDINNSDNCLTHDFASPDSFINLESYTGIQLHGTPSLEQPKKVIKRELKPLNHNISSACNEDKINTKVQLHGTSIIKKKKILEQNKSKFLISQNVSHKCKVRDNILKLILFQNKLVKNDKWIYKDGFTLLKGIKVEKGIGFSLLEKSFLKYPSVENLSKIFQPYVALNRITDENLSDLFKVKDVIDFQEAICARLDLKIKSENKKASVYLNKVAVNRPFHGHTNKNKILSKIFYRDPAKYHHKSIKKEESVNDAGFIIQNDNIIFPAPNIINSSPSIQGSVDFEETIKSEYDSESNTPSEDHVFQSKAQGNFAMKPKSIAMQNLKKRVENLKKIRDDKRAITNLMKSEWPSTSSQPIVINNELDHLMPASEYDESYEIIRVPLSNNSPIGLDQTNLSLLPHVQLEKLDPYIREDSCNSYSQFDQIVTAPSNSVDDRQYIAKDENVNPPNIKHTNQSHNYLNTNNPGNDEQHHLKIKFSKQLKVIDLPVSQNNFISPETSATNANQPRPNALNPFKGIIVGKKVQLSGIRNKVNAPMEHSKRKLSNSPDKGDDKTIVRLRKIRKKKQALPILPEKQNFSNGADSAAPTPELPIDDGLRETVRSHIATILRVRTVQIIGSSNITSAMGLFLDQLTTRLSNEIELCMFDQASNNAAVNTPKIDNQSIKTSPIHAYKAKHRALTYNLGDVKNKIYGKLLIGEVGSAHLVKMGQDEISKYRLPHYTVSARTLAQILKNESKPTTKFQNKDSTSLVNRNLRLTNVDEHKQRPNVSSYYKHDHRGKALQLPPSNNHNSPLKKFGAYKSAPDLPPLPYAINISQSPTTELTSSPLHLEASYQSKSIEPLLTSATNLNVADPRLRGKAAASLLRKNLAQTDVSLCKSEDSRTQNIVESEQSSNSQQHPLTKLSSNFHTLDIKIDDYPSLSAVKRSSFKLKFKPILEEFSTDSLSNEVTNIVAHMHLKEYIPSPNKKTQQESANTTIWRSLQAHVTKEHEKNQQPLVYIGIVDPTQSAHLDDLERLLAPFKLSPSNEDRSSSLKSSHLSLVKSQSSQLTHLYVTALRNNLTDIHGFFDNINTNRIFPKLEQFKHITSSQIAEKASSCFAHYHNSKYLICVIMVLQNARQPDFYETKKSKKLQEATEISIQALISKIVPVLSTSTPALKKDFNQTKEPLQVIDTIGGNATNEESQEDVFSFLGDLPHGDVDYRFLNQTQHSPNAKSFCSPSKHTLHHKQSESSRHNDNKKTPKSPLHHNHINPCRTDRNKTFDQIKGKESSNHIDKNTKEISIKSFITNKEDLVSTERNEQNISDSINLSLPNFDELLSQVALSLKTIEEKEQSTSA